MDERAVVTSVLRNAGEVLLLRRSDTVGSYTGRWGAVAGHVADDEGKDRMPAAAARAEIAEETGLTDGVSLVRQGEPFPVEDRDVGTRWLVHPFLFETQHRAVTTDEETTATDWVHPPAILDRDTVPRLWTSYDRVRPRVATIAADEEHGSAWLSLRALEVLRDEAALAAVGRWDDLETAERDDDDWVALETLAGDLVDCRPSMVVLANRVHRAMADATDAARPDALQRAATDTLEQAVEGDAAAAEQAAGRLPGRVATLSRSGTVAKAIRDADCEAVLVAESRPGGEGVGVAESLAGDCAVTLTTDAALAFELADWGAEALVVGADRILPDGRVVNKVGTRGAALAAQAEGIPVIVVAATDKVAPSDDWDREPRDSAELFDGDADIAVLNPTFDLTHADAVTAVVTETGELAPAEIEAIAAEHRARAAWRE